MGTSKNAHVYEVIVVGGGAAGLGVAISLRHAGIENFVVLEGNTVGASFAMWPEETRFITPSFATNSIGMLDLNSIAPNFDTGFVNGQIRTRALGDDPEVFVVIPHQPLQKRAVGELDRREALRVSWHALRSTHEPTSS